MISSVAFAVWFYAAPIAAMLFLHSALLAACFASAPWFWCAWTAAEWNDPFGSLVLFVVGAVLLWMGLDIQGFREDPKWKTAR